MTRHQAKMLHAQKRPQNVRAQYSRLELKIGLSITGVLLKRLRCMSMVREKADLSTEAQQVRQRVLSRTGEIDATFMAFIQ